MFTLDYRFVEKYVLREVNWGPVGYITYKRTYARDLSTLTKRHQRFAELAGITGSEDWWLTVLRVVEGTYSIQKDHCNKNRLPWNETKALRSAEEMYELIFNFKFTPPGRGLWMMGTPAVEKIGGAALNNCAFVSTKDIGDVYKFSEPFAFLMDMSMLGVGVGFDTLGAGLAYVSSPIKQGTHVVADTREGWVQALCALLDAFQGFSDLPEVWDVSQVRAAGEPIKTFGGVSSGPAPLVEMLKDVEAILHNRRGSHLTSGDIVDIMNLIGRCVVSGNVRRSAELAIGNPYDEEFLNLKDYTLNPNATMWRWASNNSVAAVVGMDYTSIAEKTAGNGEPGYIWLDNARRFSRQRDSESQGVDKLVSGTNPCSEQSLEDRELCCLAEVYPANHESYEELVRTLKYTYLYTKTVTLVPTHHLPTNAVMLRNRRIGVSLTGIVQAMTKFGRRQFFNMCEEGYEEIKRRDRQYSRWLCVPESIKKTSVKPSGTVSLLCGATPGIHFPHSEYYWRVIRFAANSPITDSLKAAGYRLEVPENEPNTTCAYFPVQEVLFDRSKDDVSMWEQLELAAQMQYYWSDNQVSVTVTFKPEEAKDIAKALELYETRLKSVSFLPLTEHGYEHAPYQKMTKNEYEEAMVRVTGLQKIQSNHESTDSFCDGESCQVSFKTDNTGGCNVNNEVNEPIVNGPDTNGV